MIVSESGQSSVPIGPVTTEQPELNAEYFRLRDFEYAQPLYDLAYLLEVDALARGASGDEVFRRVHPACALASGCSAATGLPNQMVKAGLGLVKVVSQVPFVRNK
jgi:hypothetical protein